MQKPTRANDVNKIGNTLGTGDLVEIINSELTGNSQAVTEVIHRIESSVAKVVPSNRVKTVAEWAIKGLWFGWNNTWNTGLANNIFPQPPAGIKTKFLLDCIAVGTKIARLQIVKASK